MQVSPTRPSGQTATPTEASTPRRAALRQAASTTPSLPRVPPAAPPRREITFADVAWKIGALEATAEDPNQRRGAAKDFCRLQSKVIKSGMTSAQKQASLEQISRVLSGLSGKWPREFGEAVEALAGRTLAADNSAPPAHHPELPAPSSRVTRVEKKATLTIGAPVRSIPLHEQVSRRIVELNGCAKQYPEKRILVANEFVGLLNFVVTSDMTMTHKQAKLDQISRVVNWLLSSYPVEFQRAAELLPIAGIALDGWGAISALCANLHQTKDVRRASSIVREFFAALPVAGAIAGSKQFEIDLQKQLIDALDELAITHTDALIRTVANRWVRQIERESRADRPEPPAPSLAAAEQTAASSLTVTSQAQVSPESAFRERIDSLAGLAPAPRQEPLTLANDIGESSLDPATKRTLFADLRACPGLNASASLQAELDLILLEYAPDLLPPPKYTAVSIHLQ